MDFADVTNKNDPFMDTTNYTQSKIMPWIIWGLGAAFFFSEYFARVAPSVMANDLMRDFHVEAFALGSLSAFFYYAYVSMQIPVGMLVDRYGPHKLLTFTALICSVGAILFASAHTIFTAEMGRLLMGFGAAFAFVGSLKLATVWFSPMRFGLLAGLTQALGMLGACVGEAPMSLVVSSMGWRNTMFLIAVIFFLLSIGIGLIVRDYPHGYPRHLVRIEKGSGFFKSLKVVLSNSQSWLNAAYAGMIYAPTAAFAELWGVNYLRQVYGLSLHAAASAVGCIFIGWAVGGPIAGWLSDRMQRRKPLMYASALLSLVLLTSVLYIPTISIYAVFVILFFYGIANTGVAISYAVAAEINQRSYAGTSMGFANMASVIIGAAFQPLIGWFLDITWNGKILDGVPQYSVHNYQLALLVLPACLIVGVILTFFVKETYCKPVQ